MDITLQGDAAFREEADGSRLPGENINERYAVFTRTITGLMHCIQKIRGFAVEEFGLKGASMNCLFFLNREDGITLSELTDLCLEDKAAVSRSIREMEKGEYVRVISENGKRYRARIFLTDAGKQAAKALDRSVQTAVEEGGRFMPPEVRMLFYKCLTGIYQNLKDYADVLEN